MDCRTRLRLAKREDIGQIGPKRGAAEGFKNFPGLASIFYVKKFKKVASRKVDRFA
jgi:hypothetical protein